MGVADNFNAEEANSNEVESVKATINEFFYNDQSLGLGANSAGDDAEAAKIGLAQEVLSFMWLLCLDDAVFGGQQ